MTSARRVNLKRLLQPDHIAVIGGSDAVTVVNECRRIGYTGRIWPVNPKRSTLAGLHCYPDVDALPEAPDAVFLAVPATPALDIVHRLATRGAGGVVCYTAGFGEDGTEGGSSDQTLVEVAGDLALIGPNCYGMINYLDKAALWPFEHGGFCPGYGAAIVTQSGMLSSDITMNQRSLPLAYMISAGNQSVLRVEDYVDVLCERDEVRALGLHIEGLKDIESFSAVARKALSLKKPLVVLKTGTSRIGSALTISHTGSLSGNNEMYQALFDKLGIITVQSPAQLIETLKFLCISGIPTGKQLAGFTCSGGGATLLADNAERLGLDFPAPTNSVSSELQDLLPAIATVSNPLDYTTPIWGITQKTQPVFEATLTDDYHAAILVQDYPLPAIDASKQFYQNDAKAFIGATAQKIPAAICSTLAENIDVDTREFLISNGVTPLQGIQEGLTAISDAAWYGQRLKSLAPGERPILSTSGMIKSRAVFQRDEWYGKTLLSGLGLNVPVAQCTDRSQVPTAAEEIGYPVALKLNSNQLAHKSDIGAVVLNIGNQAELMQAMDHIESAISNIQLEIVNAEFLVEEMAETPLLELMVSVRTDPQFGLVMTLASGGILIDLFADAVTLISPIDKIGIMSALDKLKTAPLLDGYRGREPVDRDALSDSLVRLVDIVANPARNIAEVEINPLFVYADSVVAVDVLMHTFDQT